MKLLLTGAFRCTEKQLEKIKALGCEILLQQDERAELLGEYLEADGVICNGLFLYHDIDDFKNLKYIQLTSAGLDRVPLDKIKARGIRLYNARGVYSVPMAEFALCGVLQLLKQSRFFYENQKKSVWEKHRSLSELSGKTVCIVGTGSVGTECAKRFKAFDTTVLAADIAKPQSEYYDEYLSMDKLSKALSKSDIVVLTLPLTDDTKHLFNRALFLQFKKGAILVNIARGAIVNENDLTEALQNGILGGAVLDVFEEEPLSADSPLWKMKNVILTPHNSFVGNGVGKRLYKTVYHNLEQYMDGVR